MLLNKNFWRYSFLAGLVMLAGYSLSARQVSWISHRGESLDAPENTIPAFQLSVDRNADGFECDIHMTADGKLAIIHDPTTNRTGKAALKISQSTFEELQAVDVSNRKPGFSNTRIPLFSDVLQIPGSYLCFAEIKSSEESIVEEVTRCIKESNIPKDRITVISFNANIIKKYKELNPDRKALWLTGFSKRQDGSWKYTAEELIEKLRSLKADGVSINANMQYLNAEYVKKVKDAGFIFSCWTVDSETTARKLVEMGVDSITSNRAAFLKNSIH